MKRLIDSSNAGDMPSFGPTLNAALNGLAAAKAGKKHILIITDGDPSVPDRGIIKRLKRAKISVSIIVIQPHGGGDINMMKLICNFTGGTYYRVNNPNRLPSIFVKEALITKRNLIFEDEKGIAPTMAYTSEPLRGIGEGEIPSIYGYVLTSAKLLAKVPLHILADKDQKDPLLAHIQYGLGRTVAFTSDAKNRWAANWVNWSKFDKFWLQTVRWALRKVDQSEFKVSSFTSGGKGKVAIDAVSEKGEFINFLQMQGVLILPSGHSRPFNVFQKGPGRYEGQFPVDEVGTYLINVGYKHKGRFQNLTTGLSVSFSSEYLATKANVPLLIQMADVSGGRVFRYSFMDRDNDGNIAKEEWNGTSQEFQKLDIDQNNYISQEEHGSNEEIFLHDKPRGGYPRELWPIFLSIFLVLFPIDVFIRRVLIDYNKLWASFITFLKREKKQEESSTTMNRLFQKKSSLGKSLQRGKSKSLDLASLEELGRSSGISQEQTTLTTSSTSNAPKLAPKIEKKPPKKEEPEPQDYTSRLLAAKKKTWEKKKRKD